MTSEVDNNKSSIGDEEELSLSEGGDEFSVDMSSDIRGGDDNEGHQRASAQINNSSFVQLDFEDYSTKDTDEAIKSLFADSPYFDTYVQGEVQRLEIVSAILKDVRDKVKNFTTAGTEMCKAMRDLSISCQLHNPEVGNDDEENNDDKKNFGVKKKDKSTCTIALRKRKQQALGLDMALVLQRMGETLFELATEQEKMCHIVEDAMGSHLVEISESNLMIAKELKGEADKKTQRAHLSLFDFINGGKQIDTGEYFNSLNTNGEAANSDSAAEEGGSRDSATGLSMSIRGIKKGPWWSASKFAAQSNENQNDGAKEKEKEQKICEEHTAAELQRFKLYKYLLDSKQQLNFVISRSTSDFYTEIQSYYSNSNEQVLNLKSTIDNNQDLSKRNRLKHQGKDMKLFQETENSMSVILNNICNHNDVDESMNTGKQRNNGDTNRDRALWHNTLEIGNDNEIQPLIWRLPHKLKECSLFHRPSTDGIMIEGWLYQRNVEKFLSSEHTWTRKWFILRMEGLFSLEPSPSKTHKGVFNNNSMTDFESLSDDDDDNDNKNDDNKPSAISVTATTITLSSADEVKVFDITRKSFVSKIPMSQGGPKYCFQIEIPQKKKSIVLQAIGPLQLRAWVDKIRACSTAL